MEHGFLRVWIVMAPAPTTRLEALSSRHDSKILRSTNAGCSKTTSPVHVSPRDAQRKYSLVSPHTSFHLNACLTVGLPCMVCIRSAVGTTLVTATYGLEVGEDMSDKYLSAFEIGVKSIQLFISGTSILEFVPILSRVPTWIPGTGYLRELAEIRRATHRLRDLPWNDAREAVVSSSILESPVI